MKKTTKLAALVAAVAVMGAMPGCSNTEEPEVDPRDAYVGTYDGDYVYTETYYGPYHNMIETSSFDETYEGAVVKKSGSDALDIDGEIYTLVGDKLVGETMTVQDSDGSMAVVGTKTVTGSVSGGNTIIITGEISGSFAMSDGTAGTISGREITTLKKRD